MHTSALWLWIDKVVVTILTSLNAPKLLGTYYAWRIYRHPASKPKAATPKYRLLALSREVFRGDLQILAEVPDFEVFSIPTHLQTLPMSFFYSENYDYVLPHNPAPGSKLANEQIKFQAFLHDLLTAVYQRIPVNCVVTANIKFREDIDYGMVSRKLGLPFVALHRENLVSCPIIFDRVLARQKAQGRFHGDLVIVHNEESKRLFVEAANAEPSEIEVLGCLRMDAFVSAVKKWELQKPLPQKRKTVVIFGYTTFSGVPFENDYFPDVHEALLLFMKRRSDVDFIIKLKPKDWAGRWGSKFKKVMAKLNLQLTDLPNLDVQTHSNVHDLIFKADVLSAFNSTTLLEAGLVRKPVVVPFLKRFRDTPELYQSTSMGDGLEGAFDIADTAEHLIALMEQRLVDTHITEEMMLKRRHLFEYWVSNLEGQSTNLYTNTLRKIIDHKSVGMMHS